MKPRYLLILIIFLYTLAALSMLGVGSNREKLKKLHQQEQGLSQEPGPSADADDEAQAGEGDTLATKEALQARLTTWQLVALGLFGAASLLLVLRDRLVKKPATPGNRAGGTSRR
jgi:hypothetical protein